MKSRLAHWRSTVPGVCLLVLLVVCIIVKPSVLDDLAGFVVFAGALSAILYKGKK